jgi:hypothetical protein
MMMVIIIIIKLLLLITDLHGKTYIPNDSDLYAGNAPPHLIIIIIIIIMKLETLSQH